MGQLGLNLTHDDNIIPSDPTTLFVCAGMQPIRDRFKTPDDTQLATIQSCVRTNDIDLVGDGSHLTMFRMIGNFSFGGNHYPAAVDLWHQIVSDLHLPITSVHVHPDREDHRLLWERHGYNVIRDPDCVWSDGEIGGNCCELFCNDLEIGNLVNTLGHSVDVGFGLERMVQVHENKGRVDETSLFDQGFHPIVQDHLRTVELLLQNGVMPGNKGRNYVCRRLMRRMMRHDTPKRDWLDVEREFREKHLRNAQISFNKQKNKTKPPEWWWESFGVTLEELQE